MLLYSSDTHNKIYLKINFPTNKRLVLIERLQRPKKISEFFFYVIQSCITRSESRPKDKLRNIDYNPSGKEE